MKRTSYVWIILCFFVFGLVALAQTNVIGTNAPPSGAVGLPSLAMIPLWLQVFITPLTLALVALIKKYLPQVPDGWLPVAAAVVGSVVDIVSDLIGLWGSQGLANSAMAGAALGALATWVHQLGKQSGIIGPSSPDVLSVK